MKLTELDLQSYETLKQNGNYWDRKVAEILMNEALPNKNFQRFSYGAAIVYSVEDMVIKLYPPFFHDQFDREIETLQVLSKYKLPVQIPGIRSTGKFEGWNYLLMTRLKGELLVNIWDQITNEEKIQLCKDLGSLVRSIHEIPVHHFQKINVGWTSFLSNQLKKMEHHHGQTGLNPELLSQLARFTDSRINSFQAKQVLLTGEYTPFNLIMNKIGPSWRLTGLIDFADCFLGDGHYDLLGPILFMFQHDRSMLYSFLYSYGFKKDELNDRLRRKLMIYTILHRFSDIPAFMPEETKLEKIHSFDELEKVFFPF